MEMIKDSKEEGSIKSKGIRAKNDNKMKKHYKTHGNKGKNKILSSLFKKTLKINV